MQGEPFRPDVRTTVYPTTYRFQYHFIDRNSALRCHWRDAHAPEVVFEDHAVVPIVSTGDYHHLLYSEHYFGHMFYNLTGYPHSPTPNLERRVYRERSDLVSRPMWSVLHDLRRLFIRFPPQH